MTELKPCPFCGGKMIPFYNYNYNQVPGVYEHENKDCILRPLMLTNEIQIEAWNRREK